VRSWTVSSDRGRPLKPAPERWPERASPGARHPGPGSSARLMCPAQAPGSSARLKRPAQAPGTRRVRPPCAPAVTPSHGSRGWCVVDVSPGHDRDAPEGPIAFVRVLAVTPGHGRDTRGAETPTARHKPGGGASRDRRRGGSPARTRVAGADRGRHGPGSPAWRTWRVAGADRGRRRGGPAWRTWRAEGPGGRGRGTGGRGVAGGPSARASAESG